jgi:hypothetical protein
MLRNVRFGLIVVIGICAACSLASAKSEKSSLVDSGSFGVFVNGQRIATETFNIQQRPDVSIANSEVKAADGKSSQRSELQISPAGDLRRYEWHETSPGKAQAVVEPMDEFLVERVTTEPGTKAAERPFILAQSTPVLDDYAFIHRQILLWRYLSQVCGSDLLNCRPQKVQFGVLIPHQQMSTPVTIEFVGPEKINLHGQSRELNRFNITSDDSVWSVWMDAATLKVMLMAAGNTEVVRD